MKTNSYLNLRTLFFPLLTAVCVMPAGCGMGAHDAVDAEQASKAPNRASLLVLGSAGDGHLDRIAASYSVLTSADLGLADSSMDTENARQLVAEINGVGLSLSQASDDDLAAWKPLTDAAFDAGLPVIIDGAKNPDRLAEVLGIGIEAELMLITSLGPNRHRVSVYGENSALRSYVESSEQPGMLAHDFVQDIENGFAVIDAALNDHEPSVSSKSTPTNGYQYYELDFPVYNWDITSSQTTSFDLDYEAELVLDSARGKKNVFIRPIGSGQHPGSLTWNKSSKRGYYQESQQITITPSNNNVSLYAHAPSTPNSGSTYTSSTGWTIGTSGPDPVLSYSEGNESSTTLSDFSTVNHTAGQIASWTFKMSTSWDDMFNHPAFEKCKVKSLPALSKSNLKPEFEAVYRSDSSYTGTVSFDIEIVTVMRKLERGGDAFTCKKKTTTWTNTRDRSLSINFGSI